MKEKGAAENVLMAIIGGEGSLRQNFPETLECFFQVNKVWMSKDRAFLFVDSVNALGYYVNRILDTSS